MSRLFVARAQRSAKPPRMIHDTWELCAEILEKATRTNAVGVEHTLMLSLPLLSFLSCCGIRGFSRRRHRRTLHHAREFVQARESLLNKMTTPPSFTHGSQRLRGVRGVCARRGGGSGGGGGERRGGVPLRPLSPSVRARWLARISARTAVVSAPGLG